MIKHVRAVSLLLALLACCPGRTLCAATPGADAKTSAGVGMQTWFSSADAKWQISFPYATRSSNPGIAAGTQGKMESELKFRRIDSPIMVVEAGGGLTPLFSFDVLYGYGAVAGGRGMDTDRFVYADGRREYSVSQSDLAGEVRLAGLNLYYNNNRFDDPRQDAWGLVVGFLHYSDRLMMTQGEQTVSQAFDGAYYPPVGPFSSNAVLNSTFDFSWDTLKVGASRQAALTRAIGYEALLSIYPYVSYHGEGYWNLRAGTNPSNFRTQSPNFVQKAPFGYGYEALLGLTCDVGANIGLSAGYRYFFLRALNGTHTVYFADGSSSDTGLDWATVTREGAYVGALFRF